MTILARFITNEDGATAIEYALIASLLALFIIAAVQTVATSVSTVFTEVGGALKRPARARVEAANYAGLRPELAVKVITLVQ